VERGIHTLAPSAGKGEIVSLPYATYGETGTTIIFKYYNHKNNLT